MLQTLNEEQKSAVTLPNEHALILAGAGSGKTRVLTTRIAWLIQTHQVSPAGILAVTFTNKAAREMLTRLSAMLPISTRGLWIGTFHGLCNRFLRAHHNLAALPATFQILDTQDQLSAIKRLCKALQVNEERFPPKEIQWAINGWKDDGLRPEQVSVYDDNTRRKVEIYQAYEKQCQREGVVDFAELLLRAYELLRDHVELREHYQRRFAHILVDEFQDTNRLQYAWLKLLAGGPNNAVFAVGDDDQSIYAFRGANVGNMSDFVRELGVKHQIKLEHNYRSSGHILELANGLISNNRNRLGKNLHTDSGPGEMVRAIEAPNDLEEARWLVDEVKQLVRDDWRRDQIAVLYRSNAQSRVIETALFQAGVPYRVYGGLRFFERAEIKHALAYLRLIDNPRDDTSFMRVVNFPPRGIGARSIEQLQDAAREHGCALVDAVDALPGKAGINIRAFVAKLDVMREEAGGLTLRQLVDLMLEQSGLLAHYRAERDGADRVENLEELASAAQSFVSLESFGLASAGHPSQGLVSRDPSVDEEAPVTVLNLEEPTGEVMSPLAAFLTHAALESGDHQASSGEEAVQLMTIHAAKGLEFDAVFITGLEEGLFPHENSLSSHDGLEEERRLMYVAITRARKRLYLSHAQSRMLHGQTRYNLNSRFLDELPDGHVKWITGTRFTQSSQSAWSQPSRQAAWQQPAWSPHWHGDKPVTTNESAVQVQPKDRGEQATGIRTGVKVFHTKFGEGVVKAVEGSGADARAQVQFSRHGVKWLALAVAKLTVID